jgi:hypothetical protein
MNNNITNENLKKLILYNNTDLFIYHLNVKNSIYISNMKGKHLDNKFKKGKPKKEYIENTDLVY